MIVAHQAPPLPFLPPEAYGRPAFGLLVTWAGDIAEGRRVLAPLLQVGKTLGELVRPVPYRAIQTLLDGSAAPGNGTLWRSVRLSQLSDAAIEDLVSLAESLPNRPSFLTGWMIGAPPAGSLQTPLRCSAGSAADAVADVCGLRRVDHPNDLQLDVGRRDVEQPTATTEQHRNQMDLQLVAYGCSLASHALPEIGISGRIDD
jgi:hypothetical protein